MKSLIIGFICLSVLGLGIYALAGGNACKDNFTVCTENGCGNMQIAEDCQLICVLPGGTVVPVKCKTPGQLEGNSKPETDAP